MSRREGESGRVVGRYVLGSELAAGGMATVYWGRLAGPAGFSRTVAVKRLHPQFAKDPEFATMFLDEARLASRIRHGNVVATLDVVSDDGELFLVMDYVHGESLAKLLRAASERGERVPHDVAASIVIGVLHGLDAAHAATSEDGTPLSVVHRDVSPQNVLVGADGIARVLDFGVAKAAWQAHTTRDGSLKGKLAYMAPEQLRGEPIDRRVDVFSAAILLWELLTGKRLFAGDEPQVYVQRILGGDVAAPSSDAPDVSPALDAVVMKGLALDRTDRFASAREMARALEAACPPATTRAVADWVEQVAHDALAARRASVAALEKGEAPAEVAAPDLAPPDAVVARVAAAEARVARAALPTEPELTPAPASTSPLASVAAATPPAAAGRGPAPPRPRRRGLVVSLILFAAVTIVVGGLASLWNQSPTPRSSEASSRPTAERADSLTGAPPSASTSVAAAPSDVAPAPSTGPAVSVSAAPNVGPSPSARPSRTTSRPAPRPPPSTKSGLCMKQRADGVVYFAPCP